MLAIDLANILAAELETALLHHDTVSLAVAGGTTPGPVFDALCAAELDWHRVRVMPTDERWVAPDHDRANARLIADRLLVNRAAGAQYLPFYAPAAHPEDVLPQLEANLAPVLPVSVMLLGMGADMHTASLFPGAPGLAQALAPDAPILSVLRPETQPDIRVSLSARVLAGAVNSHLIIFGADKRAALDRAMSLPPDRAPVQVVLKNSIIHWAE